MVQNPFTHHGPTPEERTLGESGVRPAQGRPDHSSDTSGEAPDMREREREQAITPPCPKTKAVIGKGGMLEGTIAPDFMCAPVETDTLSCKEFVVLTVSNIL